jgi:hypothetical protein
MDRGLSGSITEMQVDQYGKSLRISAGPGAILSHKIEPGS